MTFIHTADWHLGNRMHEIDRAPEFDAFLEWLKIQIEQTDSCTLIISGDIFDTATPPLESQKQYYNFLASLQNTCCKNVIIIGGNHDSANLLNSSRELLKTNNIHVVGSIANLTPKDMVFELFDSSGAVCAICAAVPFVREVELRNLLTEQTADKNLFGTAYKKLYDDVFAQADLLRAGRPVPIIMTGHLYAANLEGRLSSVDAQTKSDDGVKVLDVLGTLGSVPPAVFPQNADYIALGHIHYTTMVAKNPKIRYSGSPFVLGFDESQIPHYVLAVTLEDNVTKDGKKTQPNVQKIETPRTFVYKRLFGSADELKNQLTKLSSEQIEKQLFLELCYKKEAGLNIQERLEETIKQLPQKISVVSWKITEKAEDVLPGFESLDVSEIKNLEPEEVFRQLILQKSGIKDGTKEGAELLSQFLPLFLQIESECNSEDA